MRGNPAQRLHGDEGFRGKKKDKKSRNRCELAQVPRRRKWTFLFDLNRSNIIFFSSPQNLSDRLSFSKRVGMQFTKQ